MRERVKRRGSNGEINAKQKSCGAWEMGHHSDRRTSCLGRRCVIGYPLNVVSFRSYVRIPLPPLVFSSIIWKLISHTFTVPWFLFLLSLGGWCDGSNNGTSHTFSQWQPKWQRACTWIKALYPSLHPAPLPPSYLTLLTLSLRSSSHHIPSSLYDSPTMTHLSK